MQTETAQALAHALADSERARQNLINSPIEEIVDRAGEYLDAADRELVAYTVARTEAPAPEADTEAPAPGASEAPLPAEASTGVPLVAPPGVEITVVNLERYGPLGDYVPVESPAGTEAAPVRATSYAFAEGTAVATPEGTVGVSQPSRILVDTNGDLAVIPNDVFCQTYDPLGQPVEERPEGEEPTPEPPSGAGQNIPAPPPASASEPAEPAEGGQP